jgi:hypothetical protein
LSDSGETGRLSTQSRVSVGAAAGECVSDAGGESRARLPDERWKTRKGLSFWNERMGDPGGRSPGGGVVVVLRGRSLVIRVGAATSFLRRWNRGRWAIRALRSVVCVCRSIRPQREGL